MSADTQACLTLLQRHRALQLEALGITWAGSRMAALIEKLAEHAAPISLKKGNRRMEGNYKDPYYAKKKFEKTDVYDSLIQIEEAFTERVAERKWSLAERDLYLKLFLERADKLRATKLPQDKVKVQIVDNLVAFLRDLGATKGGTKRRDRARAINTILAAATWQTGSTHSKSKVAIAKELGASRRALIHRTFKQSAVYLQYLEEHSQHTIGLRLFESARPTCVKRSTWRKCADTAKVQHKEHFKAYQEWWRREKRAIEKCKCFKCSNFQVDISKALESEREFLLYLLCEEREYGESTGADRAASSRRRTTTG